MKHNDVYNYDLERLERYERRSWFGLIIVLSSIAAVIAVGLLLLGAAKRSSAGDNLDEL